MAEKYADITFVVLPMCTLNGRASNAIHKAKKKYDKAKFVLCTFSYTESYIPPGEPYEAIVIPPDINKVEDYYPYMCRWAIEKCDCAIIYTDRKSILNQNPLSVNAVKLSEYAVQLGKEVISLKPDNLQNNTDIYEDFDENEFVNSIFKKNNEKKSTSDKEKNYPDFDYDA